MLPQGVIDIRVRLRYPVSEAFLCQCRARGLTPSEVLRSLAAEYARLPTRPPAPFGLKENPGQKEPPAES